MKITPITSSQKGITGDPHVSHLEFLTRLLVLNPLFPAAC